MYRPVLGLRGSMYPQVPHRPRIRKVGASTTITGSIWYEYFGSCAQCCNNSSPAVLGCTSVDSPDNMIQCLLDGIMN